MPLEAAIPAFAISAAAILVGGAIVLRFQRDRHHFLLAQMALERGITTFPGTIPGWLVSLRVGVLTLALGVGLMTGGQIFYVLADSMQPQTSAAPAPAPMPPGYLRLEASATATAPAPGPGPTPLAPAPPPPEFHRVQNQRTASLVTICVGITLALLGIVRILFARAERKYTTEPVASKPPANPAP